MSEVKITDVRVLDLRFPTSRQQIGSDAVNRDPDYSAAYCILETDAGVEGYGLAFGFRPGEESTLLNTLAEVLRGQRTRAAFREARARFLSDMVDPLPWLVDLVENRLRPHA